MHTGTCRVMDSKPWLWKKKSSEKNIEVSSNKIFCLIVLCLLSFSFLSYALPSYAGNGSKIVRTLIQKEKALELERSLEDLNEQLSSVRTESSAKDDLLAGQAKVAEEAIAG